MKRLREAMSLNQHDAANLIGCTTTTLSRYENGIRTPDLDMLNVISRVYNVTPAHFVDDSYGPHDFEEKEKSVEEMASEAMMLLMRADKEVVKSALDYLKFLCLKDDLKSKT
jgi:transcriptional regulator with XRE-family HTH domain